MLALYELILSKMNLGQGLHRITKAAAGIATYSGHDFCPLSYEQVLYIDGVHLPY